MDWSYLTIFNLQLTASADIVNKTLEGIPLQRLVSKHWSHDIAATLLSLQFNKIVLLNDLQNKKVCRSVNSISGGKVLFLFLENILNIYLRKLLIPDWASFQIGRTKWLCWYSIILGIGRLELYYWRNNYCIRWYDVEVIN